jgi:hypothetical protein
MAKAPYKLPSVFVGCPYGGKFPFASFKSSLERVPFRWYYADTHLSTKHLLGILRTYIKAVDYCIFDISLWNANVALELGLAEGLGVEYYILLNKKLSKGVPADIQGLQRIEYSDTKGLSGNSLLPGIIKYLVKQHTHPRNIYNELSGENRETKFYFALSLLSHLRDNTYLSRSDIARLARGTYLRKESQDEVLRLMSHLGVISSWETKRGATLRKHLFPEVLKAGQRRLTTRPTGRSPATRARAG